MELTLREEWTIAITISFIVPFVNRYTNRFLPFLWQFFIISNWIKKFVDLSFILPPGWTILLEYDQCLVIYSTHSQQRHTNYPLVLYIRPISIVCHPSSTVPTICPCTYDTVITLETSDVSALPTLFSHSPQSCQTSCHYKSFCTESYACNPSANRSLYTGMYTVFTQKPCKMRMTDMLNIRTHDIQSLSTYWNIKHTYVKQISNTDSTLPSPLKKKHLPA